MSTLTAASLRSRVSAFAIDALLLYVTLTPLLWLLHQVVPDLAGGWMDKSVQRVLPALILLACWHLLAATPGQMISLSKIVDAKTGGAMSPRQCLLRWIVFIASAVPFGIGFLWCIFDPQKRPLHDSLSGTTVVRHLPSDRKGPRTLRELVQAHWRGELPLAISFWQNTVLVLLPLLLLAVRITVEVNVNGDLLRLGSAVLLIVWPLMLVLACWSIVGTWRAAVEYGEQSRGALGSLASFVMLGALGAILLSSALFEFLPRAGQYLQLINGSDPLGQADMTMSEDQGHITIHGPLGMRDGARFLSLAATSPTLRSIEIESTGGRLFEAIRIADLIKDRKLHLRVAGACEDACALLFLAADHRQVMLSGTVGFRHPSAGILSPLMNSVLKPDALALFRRYGAAEPVIANAFAGPAAQLWRPSRRDLVDADLIDPLPQTLDIALPPAGAIQPLQDLVEALRDNPGWYLMEQSRPGLIAAAAQRMDAARSDPANDGDRVQAEGQDLITAMLPELLQKVGNERRSDYVLIWRDQLKAARTLDAQACKAVLSADTSTKRKLPQEVVAQEASWLIQVMASGDTQATPRPVNNTEIAVLTHQLGERAPGLLAGLYVSTRKNPAAMDCDRVIGILDAVAGLPNSVRPVAARALFQ
ncbi:RDD family protein [Burkholderiaceae bacterium UC74_6]